MNNKYTKLQDKIITYLTNISNLPLPELCKYNCSEISRLVGYWLFCDNPENQYLILKGENVMNNMAHDVLLIKNNESYDLLDPSIWQFFPKDKSIYLNKFNSVKDACEFLEDKYRGKWSLSERLDEQAFKEKSDWVEIIESNIREAEE